MANQSYTYQMKAGKSKAGLISAVKEYLSSVEKMETQIVTDEEGYNILQARAKSGKWKQFVGLDKAITIRFIKKSDREICMEFGEAKWVDKGVAMATSMFILWPLAVTSGIGIYQQSQLPAKIKEVADKYMEVDNRIEETKKKPLISEFTAAKLGPKLAYAFQKLVR